MELLQSKVLQSAILNLMQEYELATRGVDFDWQTENRLYHITKLAKIVTKYHYRAFLNNFKWYVFQLLLKITARPHPHSEPQLLSSQSYPNTSRPHLSSRDISEWSYYALLRKRNKSEHEMLELEFINMCAQKIQAVFKGYLQRKRHRLAAGRLARFIAKARALVLGWKTRQIMRIVKLKEEARTIGLKRAEVGKQEEVVMQTTNKYSMRKLEYLKRTLQEEVKQFSNKFECLYSSGAWVFEPKIAKSAMLSVTKWKKRNESAVVVEPIREANYHETKLEQYVFVAEEPKQVVPKPKRTRQMRDRNRATKPQEKEQKQQVQKTQLENKSYTNTNSSSLQGQNQFMSVQDRPIQAKGSYALQDLPIQPAQSELGSAASKVLAEIKPQNSKSNEQSNNGGDATDKKTQLKQRDKMRMQKRKKYDPRKAIEQEKQRKKQQASAVPQPQAQQKVVPSLKAPVKSEDVVPSESKERNVKPAKSQKIIKTEKEELSSRSTVNLPKNNKGKVEAKIDCWGNRKTNKKPTPPENNRMTYKLIHAPSKDDESGQEDANRQTDLPAFQMPANRIRERPLEYRRPVQERPVQERQRPQYSEERMKVQRQTELRRLQSDGPRREQIQLRREAAEGIRRYMQQRVQQGRPAGEEVQGAKAKLSTPLREKMRLAQEQRQRELHKSIEQLQRVYTDQYQNRYQRLLPKLGLLAAARQRESGGAIPVLLESGEFMRRQTGENLVTSKFWLLASKIERSFKEFDRTN